MTNWTLREFICRIFGHKIIVLKADRKNTELFLETYCMRCGLIQGENLPIDTGTFEYEEYD